MVILFVGIEVFKPFLVGKRFIIPTYKWSKQGVFKEQFSTYLFIQTYKLDTELLNLQGIHSLVN